MYWGGDILWTMRCNARCSRWPKETGPAGGAEGTGRGVETTRAAVSTLRPATMISAPACARPCAMPRPMPPLPPVTKATLPASVVGIFCPFRGDWALQSRPDARRPAIIIRHFVAQSKARCARSREILQDGLL